jgi:hypothetical protein
MGNRDPTMGNGAMVPHGLLPHDTRLHPAANPAGLYGFQVTRLLDDCLKA